MLVFHNYLVGKMIGFLAVPNVSLAIAAVATVPLCGVAGVVLSRALLPARNNENKISSPSINDLQIIHPDTAIYANKLSNRRKLSA